MSELSFHFFQSQRSSRKSVPVCFASFGEELFPVVHFCSENRRSLSLSPRQTFFISFHALSEFLKRKQIKVNWVWLLSSTFERTWSHCFKVVLSQLPPPIPAFSFCIHLVKSCLVSLGYNTWYLSSSIHSLAYSRILILTLGLVIQKESKYSNSFFFVIAAGH